MAAIILKQSFRYGWNINMGTGSYDFFDYMTRPGVFKSELHDDKKDMYYDYMEYMKNEEKSDGAFDSLTDKLNDEQIKHYRELEYHSRENGCPKYLGVISFENKYLMQYGMMDSEGNLNHKLLKDYTRQAITEMINTSKKLKNNNVYWTAAIHENTDNIHIHFQLLEYERLEDRKTKYRDKDMLETKCFEKLKSKMVNLISPATELKNSINDLRDELRDLLVPSMQAQYTNCDGRIIDLYNKISASKKPRKWQYGSYEKTEGHKEDRMKKEIDSVVRCIINSDSELKSLFTEFNNKLNKYDDWNTYLYGKRKDVPKEEQIYSFNKRDEFYKRAGNKLLEYMRDFGSELKKVKSPVSELPYLSEKETENYAKEILPKLHTRIRQFYDKPKAIAAHNGAASMIKRLQSEYKSHIRQLQREFEYEQEKKERENQYAEYIDDTMKI